MDHIPVLKIGKILLVSIQVDMDDKTAVALQDDLTERIIATGARGVIIDITALDIVDSFIGRVLGSIASVSRVLSAETVVVGMRPAVAITLVELGLSLTGVRTALNVERGMRMLGRSLDGRSLDGRPAGALGTPGADNLAVDDRSAGGGGPAARRANRSSS